MIHTHMLFLEIHAYLPHASIGCLCLVHLPSSLSIPSMLILGLHLTNYLASRASTLLLSLQPTPILKQSYKLQSYSFPIPFKILRRFGEFTVLRQEFRNSKRKGGSTKTQTVAAGSAERMKVDRSE
jgi:hypothetical protein